MADTAPEAKPTSAPELAAVAESKLLAAPDPGAAPSAPAAPQYAAGASSSGVEILPYNPEAGDEEEDDDEEEGGAGGEPPRKKRGGHGRRKIEIEYIDDKIRRHITFSKRKAGISKKAYELSRLTGAQVTSKTQLRPSAKPPHARLSPPPRPNAARRSPLASAAPLGAPCPLCNV